MSYKSTIDHKFNIEGTLLEERFSGRISNANIAMDKASGMIETLEEADGAKVYIGGTSPLGADFDHVFIKVFSGSIQVRFGPADSWVTIPYGLIIHGESITYMAIQATPDGFTTGTGTYQLIVSRTA
jgi:hypothetical protein